MSLWNIAGALAGGLFGGDDTETSKQQSPWGPAQPWIQSNIGSGQTLQNYYQQNPFSQSQLNAYGNSAALTDNFRNTSASLIDQMNGMKQFDRSNPEAKPTQFNFSTPSTGGTGTGSGSLGFSNPFGMNQQQQKQMQSLLQPQQGGDSAAAPYSGGGNVNDMFHSLQGLINSPMGGQIASMLGNTGLLGNMSQNGANVPVGYADSGGGGSYNSGYGSNSQGGSPDGYW